MVGACASHYGAAKIVSDPAGAQVISDEDGSILGITPTTIWWKADSNHRQYRAVKLIKEGYYDSVASFWLSMSHSSQKRAEESPILIEETLKKKGS
jgi:hypothetical protein